MAVQFIRDYTAIVGNTEIRDLRCAFVVEKKLSGGTNKLGLRIWGLTPEHRKTFADSPNTPIQLSAGYRDAIGLIFLGRVRNAQNKYENPGWVTEFGSGDGEQEVRTARVAVTLAKGAGNDVAIRQIARALGVRLGNLEDAVSALVNRKVFPLGTVIYGSAAREMTAACQAAGLEWSIQDGALQLIPRGRALVGRAVKLDASTDLIGSAEIDAKGVVKVRCQLQPDVNPGRVVVIDSAGFSGQIRAERVIHSGDTHGQEWLTEIEGKRY